MTRTTVKLVYGVPVVRLVHDCDEDCMPFIVWDDDEKIVGQCSVCGNSFGEPCPKCGKRGFHADDCPEMTGENER
ncbi:MAG: hypothetical protein FJW35_15710 [Acidobacteria bacterium]|nr:hypothetical protein [Acidobacteriota bacterium]